MERLINRYYRSVVEKLVYLTKDLQTDPLNKRAVCYELQEALILNISKIERKIRKLKAQQSEIKQKLGNREAKNTKEEAALLKDEKRRLIAKIDEYQEFRFFLKSIGDAIAFLYINKYDLKPQNFKQSTGFITNKVGSRLERKCWRYAFKKGGIAILNDLTNVLKYFDMTLIVDHDAWYPIEIKSGSPNPIQAEKGAELLRYLIDDTPTDIYDIGHKQHRMAPVSEIINHVDFVNKSISQARGEGYAFSKLEDGFFILIFFEDRLDKLDTFFKDQELKKPIFFMQNDHKFGMEGYYPYILSIASASDYLDFISGKLTMILVLDLAVLETLAVKHGYKCDWPGEREAMIRFVSKENTEFQVALSQHYFGRIFSEYLSPSSLVMESINMMNEMMAKFRDKPLAELEADDFLVPYPPTDLISFKKYIKKKLSKSGK